MQAAVTLLKDYASALRHRRSAPATPYAQSRAKQSRPSRPDPDAATPPPLSPTDVLSQLEQTNLPRSVDALLKDYVLRSETCGSAVAEILAHVAERGAATIAKMKSSEDKTKLAAEVKSFCAAPQRHAGGADLLGLLKEKQWRTCKHLFTRRLLKEAKKFKDQGSDSDSDSSDSESSSDTDTKSKKKKTKKRTDKKTTKKDKGKKSTKKDKDKKKKKKKAAASSDDESDDGKDSLKQLLQQALKGNNHNGRNNNGRFNNNTNNGAIQCRACGGFGHIARNCPSAATGGPKAITNG